MLRGEQHDDLHARRGDEQVYGETAAAIHAGVVGEQRNAPAADEGTYYGNFEAEFRNFWTNGSYYSIFAGLGYFPDHPLPSLAYKPQSVQYAERLFDGIKQQQQELVDTLPGNHDYLRGLHNAPGSRPGRPPTATASMP